MSKESDERKRRLNGEKDKKRDMIMPKRAMKDILQALTA